MQVSSNGLISFNNTITSHSPVLFPNLNYRYTVAPFWADHDLRPAGQVSYEVYSKSNTMSSVNRFIRQQTESDFEGSWMLIAKWDNIPEAQSNIDKVIMWHNITYVNTKQKFSSLITLVEWLPQSLHHFSVPMLSFVLEGSLNCL